MQATRIVKALTLVYLAALPSFARSDSGPGAAALPVLQYVDMSGKANVVLIGGGLKQDIVEGSIFKSYRRMWPVDSQGMNAENSGPVWVETGTLKATSVQEGLTVASVVSQGTPLSQAFFPKFPGVMAGDAVVMEHIQIAKNQLLLPTTTLRYDELFLDPKATPLTFELTAKGKDQLRQAAFVYAKARVPMLLVEGFTDAAGSSQANQIESYQRALTVRQFLIRELGFDEKRVTAVGLGETNVAPGEVQPNFAELSRRIVLKVVDDRPPDGLEEKP